MPDAEELVGRELRGKWRVGPRLGAGSCSSVHEAEALWQGTESFQTRTARPGASYVAKISVLDPDGAAGKKKKASEAQRMADLLHGEHMAYVNILNRSDFFPSEGPFGYGNEHGYRYLIMERLGVSLETALEAGECLPPTDVGALGQQLLGGLEYLHSKGYVYVDMKPGNIMMGRWDAGLNAAVDLGEARLVDFGLMSKYTTFKGSHRDEGGDVAPPGTPRFLGLAMHLEGTTPCRRDDLESMGYVLVCAASGGHLPWDRDMTSEDQLRAAKQAAGAGRNVCLGVDLPEALADPLGAFIDICRAMGHSDRPDYARLRGCLDRMQAVPKEASGGVRGPRGQINEAAPAPGKRKAASATAEKPLLGQEDAAARGRSAERGRGAKTREVVDLEAAERQPSPPAPSDAKRPRSTRPAMRPPRTQGSQALRGAASPAAPVTSQGTPVGLCIEAIRGPYNGQIFMRRIEDGALDVIIGHGVDNGGVGVSLDKDPLVSTQHGRIQLVNQGNGPLRRSRRVATRQGTSEVNFFFSDLGSSNGSKVAGRTARRGVLMPVANGSTLRVGDTELRVAFMYE